MAELEADYDEEQELEPLVTKSASIGNNENNEREKEYEWTKYHTIIALLIRIMADFIFKGALVFYENYAEGLGLTDYQYGYVMIATEIGCITAMFIGPINEYFFDSTKKILIFYTIVMSISCIFYIIPNAFYMTNITFILIWCCISRYFTGLSFANLSGATIEIASKNHKNPVQVIALLHYSWPLSTTFNIFAGYFIQYISWTYVYLISGIVLHNISKIVLLKYYSINVYRITL